MRSILTSDSSSLGEQRPLGREAKRPGVEVSEDLLFMMTLSVLFDFFPKNTTYYFDKLQAISNPTHQLSGHLQEVVCTRHLTDCP